MRNRPARVRDEPPRKCRGSRGQPRSGHFIVYFDSNSLMAIESFLIKLS